MGAAVGTAPAGEAVFQVLGFVNRDHTLRIIASPGDVAQACAVSIILLFFAVALGDDIPMIWTKSGWRLSRR